MTREEAIDFLIAGYPDSCYEELREAFDMAIEALSQPVIGSCSNCKWREEIAGDRYSCNRYSCSCPNSLVVGSYVEPDFYCKYWEESEGRK